MIQTNEGAPAPKNHAPKNHAPKNASGAKLVDRQYLLAFILVTCLFFFWAIANNFNDILIKQFQKALDLTRMQSGLVQSAFYFGYFTMALPAGWVMKKWGYKNGIILGLCLYALGAFLFFPAANARQFSFFLGALFVIASGLAFLETAANPYVTHLGPVDTGAQRLNFAQSFNGFGAFIAPILGGAAIFSGIEHSPAELAAMTPTALEAYRASEAQAVQMPYLLLGLAVLTLAAIIFFTKFPTLEAEKESSQKGALARILKSPTLPKALIAQFLYVGAQVGVWSYFINFAQDLTDIGEKAAAHYLSISLMVFMIGRFLGTFLMRFLPPARLLSLCAIFATLCCFGAIVLHGLPAVVALGLTSFFMSVMFPTIFATGVAGLGDDTKLASSLLIMTIIGGAIFPPIMGQIADKSGNMQYAIIMPLLAFVVIYFYARGLNAQISTKREAI